MKEFLKALFSESEQVSSMRIMALLSLSIAGAIAFISLFNDKGLDSSASVTIGIFVGAAFGGKVSQKMVESKKKATSKKG
jgi:hypothetical protein